MKELIKINRVDYENIYGDFFKALDEFPIEDRDCDIEFKAENMIVFANKIYQQSKKEIEGIFTLNEAWLIIATFNGYLYTPQLDDKCVLKAHIEDGIYYEGLDELYEVNKDKLLEKIENLTESQSFAVIRMAIEFLYTCHPLDQEDDLIRIFGIR